METGKSYRMGAGLLLAIGLIVFVLPGAAAQAPSPGDAVEVREGDVWSPAEFLGREGRRLQIRYEDGTEEWITADRLRMPGGEAAVAGGGEAEPAVRRFRTGQTVELKSMSRWAPAEIKRASPPLYLVAPDGWQGENQFHWRWVDADRLRAPGEDHDGPDAFSQFEHRVNNDSIRASRGKAIEAYEDHQRKEAQTARDDEGERDPFAAPPFAYETIDADRASMQTQPLVGGAFLVAATDPGDNDGRRRPFAAPIRAGAGEFFESPETLAVAGDYGLVVVMDSPPGGAKKGYAERFDLRAGRTRGHVALEDGWLPLAIDATGKRLAGRADGFHAGSKARLDIWDWSGRTPSHLVSFTPVVTGSESWRDVEDVAFADAETVVLRTNDGGVSGWSVGAGEAVGLWEARPPRGQRIAAWAVSPGGAQVALLVGDAVLLIEAATGRTLSTLPGAESGMRSLAFSPSGRYLAAAAVDRVKRWDLTAAEAGPSIALPPGGGADVLAFDDGSVLSKGRRLDGATGGLVWSYEMARGRAVATAVGRYLAVDKSPDGGVSYRLSGWPLPDPRAERGVAPGPAATLLGDGDAVAIDVSRLEADAATKRAIESALREQAEARGARVVDDASSAVRFVGVTTTQREQRVYEERFGAPWHREQTEVNVDLKTTRLALEADGKPAWAWVTTRAPSLFVTRREGQSVQEAVDASFVGGGAESMSSVTLPDVVPDPRAEAAGSSRLVPGGYE